jgi:signal recognition particle subunit SRP54
MIPGIGKQLEGLDQVNEKELARVEAIVLSMTPDERRLPHLINGQRRQRIARGSGTTVEQVNRLLEARKQMAQMMKHMGKGGKLPALPPQFAQGLPGGAPARSSSATKSKRKKRKSKSGRR